MAKADPSSSSQILATLLIILQFAIVLISFSGARAVIPNNNGTIQFIKTSCNSTTYPQLCYHSLSIYATKIKADPKSLASIALNITLQTTRRASATMKKLAKTTAGGLRPLDSSALSDCLEQLSDSMEELQQSIGEMNQNVRSTDLGMKMSDIQTWVSAALTNEDTCMDGFDGDQVHGDWIKILIRKHIIKVSELTSNALALINQYAHRLPSN